MASHSFPYLLQSALNHFIHSTPVKREPDIPEEYSLAFFVCAKLSVVFIKWQLGWKIIGSLSFLEDFLDVATLFSRCAVATFTSSSTVNGCQYLLAPSCFWEIHQIDILSFTGPLVVLPGFLMPTWFFSLNLTSSYFIKWTSTFLGHTVLFSI